MSTIKIALVQMEQEWENPVANLQRVRQLLEGKEANVFVLPEMLDTGFSMRAEELAQAWDNNSSKRELQELSKDKNAAIYTSLMCEENGKFYNRGVFFLPNGEMFVYDKRQLFSLAGEDNVYTAGNKEQIVTYQGIKFNLQICYDLRFPELVRNRVDATNQNCAYDVLLYVANWPERRDVHWNSLLQARAIENQCYVVGVNRVGQDGNGLNYRGSSQCINALGESERLEDNREEVKTMDINLNELKEIREKIPFLKDRTC